MKSKSIQEKLAELDKQIEWFDSEDFVLEEAVERFKLAEKLAEEVKTDLESVKNDITVLAKKFNQGE